MTGRVLLYATQGWPSVARYAAAFAQAGCAVGALSPRRAPVAASRYVESLHAYNALLPHASLDIAITRFRPDLIVPCDDRATAHLLSLHARAPRHSPATALIERSLGAPANYGRMMARNTFMAEAMSLGIRVPKTFPVTGERDLDSALAETGFPAVLKADGTWGGDGVIIARTREEARAAFRKLAHPASRLRSVARAFRRRDAHFLLSAFAPKQSAVSVQNFVAGKPAASAFAAWKGNVAGAVYYDMVKTDGPMGPPNVIRRVDCPEIAEVTRKVAAHFGLSGLHGLDFIRDAEGHVHLLEINPRATQGGTLGFGPGRDAPAALAGCIAPDAKARAAIENDLVAIFPREWRHDPLSPWLTRAHHDVPWDDPGVLQASLGMKPPRRKARRGLTASSVRPQALPGHTRSEALP